MRISPHLRPNLTIRTAATNWDCFRWLIAATGLLFFRSGEPEMTNKFIGMCAFAVSKINRNQ